MAGRDTIAFAEQFDSDTGTVGRRERETRFYRNKSARGKATPRRMSRGRRRLARSLYRRFPRTTHRGQRRGRLAGGLTMPRVTTISRLTRHTGSSEAYALVRYRKCFLAPSLPPLSFLNSRTPSLTRLMNSGGQRVERRIDVISLVRNCFLARER